MQILTWREFQLFCCKISTFTASRHIFFTRFQRRHKPKTFNTAPFVGRVQIVLTKERLATVPPSNAGIASLTCQ